MKKLFGLFIGIALLATSCSKDESTDAEGNLMMSYKVNGKLIELKSNNGGVAAQVDGLGAVVIFGVQTGGNGITIKLKDSKVGKYDLADDFTANHATYTSIGEIFTTENKGDGTVEITSSTATNLKGKFSFKGTGFDGSKTVTVSEGNFDVPVTK